MPKHDVPILDDLREAYLDAQATYWARVSDTSDAAEEKTALDDAARAYGAACDAAGARPNHEDD